MTATFEDLKSKLLELSNEEDKKGKLKDQNMDLLGEASMDYVLEYKTQSNPFQSFSLATEKAVQKNIIDEIKNRVHKYNNSDIIDFDFTKELGHHQIGKIELSNCPERLGQIVKASNQPNRKSFSLSKENKPHIIAYIITISHKTDNNYSTIKVIKKMNLVRILSKNKKKAQIGLTKGTVKGMPSDLVLISPESFDVVVLDDTAFVFDERNFHFLFSEPEYLKNKVTENSEKLDSSFTGGDILISYAARNPSILRGLYHVLNRQKPIHIARDKVSAIENKIKVKTGISDTIFEYSNEKIVCTEDNAKYIYWLIAKKYGLNMIDDDIFVTGSQYPVK